MPFLPLTRKDMESAGITEPDIIIVTGDAYVDHPSFGTAIISRVLEAAGYSVCIISQPKSNADYMEFGRPRLAFFVNSGNIDSMVAHYTAAKKKRSDDAYTAGGKAGDPTARLSFTQRKSESFSEIYRLLSVVWRLLFAVLRTTIIGMIRSVPQFL